MMMGRCCPWYDAESPAMPARARLTATLDLDTVEQIFSLTHSGTLASTTTTAAIKHVWLSSHSN